MPYIAAVLIFLAGIVGASNFMTLGQLNALSFSKPLIGVSLTTINSSTKISDLATILPANFNALNAGKIENSTTSLPLLTTTLNLTSVGTIGTGLWRGTAIEVGYGGTGTTSPTSNLVILGNGSAGFKTVNGFGTTGQFLTSTGASSAPTWQTSAIDTAINYTWTGIHAFNGTTTIAANNSGGGLSPVGSITAYASSSPPTGWLSADGAAISRTTYANLFAIIGTTYGIGDNSTTFNLPNLLGRNILMASSTANMAQSGGESNHTMTAAELVTHTHTFNIGSATGGGGLNAAFNGTDANSNTGSTGTTVPFNVLDPYLTAWYIIKY